MSLLGAVAYALLTRVDVAVYVVALQRVSHAPRVLHVRRLNVATRWTQRNPQSAVYRPMKGPVRLLARSDSAFKKEDDSGHAVRGNVVVLTNASGSLKEELNLPLKFELNRLKRFSVFR